MLEDERRDNARPAVPRAVPVPVGKSDSIPQTPQPKEVSQPILRLCASTPTTSQNAGECFLLGQKRDLAVSRPHSARFSLATCAGRRTCVASDDDRRRPLRFPARSMLIRGSRGRT
ncbi:hypothetical protein Y032_0006g2864 [Ancylostoma ceylanicum]|uniref:Uncharacterized protein n=1 Tax=Ancylostoma ceylanicum TaxID=53326 RepID=A0A016VR48_9BILA|nr:hypothetical protein Y032_0006g2864 [Ancylostoma ceylanicum]